MLSVFIDLVLSVEVRMCAGTITGKKHEVFNCREVCFNMYEYQSLFSQTFVLKQSCNLIVIWSLAAKSFF